MYEKHFTKDELNHVKASEIREFKKLEDVISIVLLLLLFMAFISFVSLVSLILWFGKLTLFIFIVVFAPTIMFYVSAKKLNKEYKELIEKTKSRIKELEV